MALKDIADIFQDRSNKKRIEEDQKRFLLYQGHLKEIVKDKVRREFESQENINRLIERVIPINIVEKIVDKLAGVYNQAPMRSPVSESETDQDLIDMYSSGFKINQKMKFSNRFFKLHKHTVLEPFLDHLGIPRLRVLPSHRYTPINKDPLQPERMTGIIKHIKIDRDPRQTILSYWDDDQHFLIDGEGRILIDQMRRIDNENGENPFGVLPFTYISETDDGSLIPIPDDDLVTVQIVISLLLTDIAVASKYQAFPIIAAIGDEIGDQVIGPSTIVQLSAGSDIKAINPGYDPEKPLRFVESLLAMLMTTKNLSAGEISGKLDPNSVGSGVSKMLDQAVSTEDKMDQEEFFANAEIEMWDKFANNILPYYVNQNLISENWRGAFSDDFKLSIQFAEQKPYVSDKELCETVKMKLEAGLITREMAIKELHGVDSEKAQQIIEQIDRENVDRENFFTRNRLNGQEESSPQV